LEVPPIAENDKDGNDLNENEDEKDD